MADVSCLCSVPKGRKFVPLYESVTKETFTLKIYKSRHPAVLKGVELGEAVDRWTPEYLASSQAADTLVKVHVCSTAKMDFLRKNFVYRSLPFGKFVAQASRKIQPESECFLSQEEKYYLRSLGDDPRKVLLISVYSGPEVDISDINVQFPSLAKDIKIPEFFPKEHFFSSVFRIGSPGVQLWTHYDIMDNLLIQVTGRKRVVLYSPGDATNLYLNGDKSEVLDIDNPDLEKYPKFAEAVAYECFLEPGDVLFIPALWFHNVISLDFGVAVNVFWRHLNKEMYDSKDTYGNKDLVPASRAMQIMDRAVKALEELPEEYRDFYARRIVCKLKSRCYKTKNNVPFT